MAILACTALFIKWGNAASADILCEIMEPLNYFHAVDRRTAKSVFPVFGIANDAGDQRYGSL